MFERLAFRGLCRSLQRILFASMFFIFGGIFAAGAYTVTYSCGFYDTGTTPPSSVTATANTSFTPAANTCVAPSASGANFTGWLVSGTSDIKQPGTAFTWEYDEDKTFTALWSCYWNSDETACVTGYKITLLMSNSGCRNPTYPMEPTILYTIPTRGAYLDEARTLLMTKTDNPIQLAHLEFMIHFDTNAPLNPEHSIQYSVPSVPSENIGNYQYGCPTAMNPTGSIYAGHGYTSTTCFIHNNPDNYTDSTIPGLTPNNRDGYLTDEGIYEAENQYTNQNWVVRACSWSSSPFITSPSLTGYTFVNWCTDPLNTTYCFRGKVPNDVQEGTYYAHWTPNTYDVVYNPGAHAASGSTAYTDTDGATYDSPYNTLSFTATPVSNNMSADTGYVFVGWTTDSTPTFTNGNLNNQYTGDTYWKRTSALSLYAAYDCDTANGYQWNTNHTACENLYTVTYNCGNNGSGNPVSQSVNPQTSTSVTFHNASVCTPNSGYEFWYWNCVLNVYNSVQTTMPGITRYISGDETCTAIYREPCPNSGRRVNLLTGLGGPSVTDTGISSAASHDISFESNSLGTLTTEGMCAGNSGTQFLPGNPTGTGDYCWCHMTYFTPTGGTAVNLSSYSNWVYITELTSCSEMSCDVLCNRYISSSPGNGTVLNQSLYEACVYDLNYTCGSAGGSVSTPQQQTNIPYNMTETWASGVSGCSQSSALLQGWNCHQTGNVSTTTPVTSANNTYSITMPNYHVTCDAQWPDVWTVDFDNCESGGQTNPAQQNTVTNGNPMTLPSSCNGTASTDEYDFRGWMCVDSDGQITFVNSSPYSYSVQSNTVCYAIWDIANPCAPGITEHYVLEQQEEDINDGEWNGIGLDEFWNTRADDNDPSELLVMFGGYNVGLNTMCSQTSGIPGMPATSTLSDTDDENCWCQVNTVNGEPLEGEYPWVFAGSVSDCQSNCFNECFLWMMGEHGMDAMKLFLQSLYTRNVCKYNLRYTCGTGSSGNVIPTSGFNYESGVQINLYQSGQAWEFEGTPSLSGCSYSNNYSLRGWNCHESGQNQTLNPNLSTSITMPANNVICDAIWGYQLKYDCGAGTGNQWVAGTYNVGTSNTVSTAANANGHCTAPNGYQANVTSWNCGGQNTNVTPGNSITISDNTTCVAQWTQIPTYALTYTCGSASGNNWAGGSYVENYLVSVLNSPTNCTAGTGQVFTGWNCTYNSGSSTLTLNQCSLSGLDASISGGMLQYGYINADGSSVNATTYNLTQNETWADRFSYGTINGKSKCSSTGGTYMQTGAPSDTSGKYCWCKVTDYTASNQDRCVLDNVGEWIMNRTDFNDATQCQQSCAASCADYLNVGNRSDYRAALFNVAGPGYYFTMPAYNVTCAAQWDCDSTNGYYWNSNNTQCINTYTLTYVAGVPNGVTVSGMPNPNPITLAYNTNHVLATGVTAAGYTHTGWDCKDSDNNTVTPFHDHYNNYQLSITMPASNVICTGQWTQNTVYLRWEDDNNPSNNVDTAHGSGATTQCVYGGVGSSITVPSAPTKQGYSFNGWKVTNWECDLSVIDASINGNSGYGTNNTWLVDFSYGSLSGISKCIATGAAATDTCSATGTQSDIDYACPECWCKLTAYTPTNGTQCNVSTTSWQHYGDFYGNCTNSCATYCAMFIRMGGANNLRSRVLQQSH